MLEGERNEQSNAKYKTSIVGLQCNLQCGEQRKRAKRKREYKKH